MSSPAIAEYEPTESDLPFVTATVFYCADIPRASAYGFDNTANEPNSTPRESLEARFFAFWK